MDDKFHCTNLRSAIRSLIFWQNRGKNLSTAALGFAFQKLNYSFIKISYFFKKFLSNELKFCTSYKNKSITWVGALNASLFRSSLKKRESYKTIYPKKLYHIHTEFLNLKYYISHSIAFNIQKSNNFTLAAALHRFAANLPPTFVS